MNVFGLKLIYAVLGLTLGSAALAGPLAPRIGAIDPAVADILVPLDQGSATSAFDFFETSDALLWLAQESTEGESGSERTRERYGRDDSRSPAGNVSALNKGSTNMIVKIIGDANQTCASPKMAVAYRVDCLRVYYGWVADKLPDNGDYAPIKKAMRQAEAKLERIVAANLDPKAERIEPKEGFKKNAKRLPPLRAVKKTAVKKVARQAAAVVEEAELIIIRSGGDPARRTPHFNAVADAVEDNLVILRSA